jgi:enoyl-CoA hydratase/carnithine racemase
VDSAELGTPEVDAWALPNDGARLAPAARGRKRALELVLTGDRLKAEEALRWGS